ncbi:hypothetical protein R5R35_000539 [Gryllus longicercus]|uniref:Adhesion G protein-coupled receptor A3 n=1 Tax=Gryllus longicercus TaxID=2509291 RepID=A0AAN9VU95_9ORTH
MMKWGVQEKDFFISVLVLLYSIQVIVCMEDDTPCPVMCKCSKTSTRVKIKCMKVERMEELDLQKAPSNVIQLDLSENFLTKIPSESFAFSSMKLLQKLNLSRNVIEFIDSDAFGNLTNLKRLDISHNKLQNLGSSVFNGLESLERLSVSQNHFVRISEGSFDPLLSLKQLDLSGNPLHCDCKLLWLIEWIQNSSVKLAPSPKCSSPSSLRGQPIRKLSTEHGVLCDLSLGSSGQQLELKPAHNQVVFEGDPLQLRCSVPSIFENRNEVRLTWLWGSQDALSAFEEIEIEDQYYSDRGLIESSLTIKHLLQEHSGQWFCQLTSEYGNHTQAIRVIVISDKTQYCPQKETVTNKGRFLWPKTVVGFTVELPCKPQEPGVATTLKAQYTCSSEGNWDYLNTSVCPYTSETTKILEQFSHVNLSISTEAILKSATRLKNFIGNGKQLHDKMDIVFISKVIENYIMYITKEKELGGLLVDIVSTVMNLPKDLIKAAQLEDHACSRMVNAVENVAEFTSSLQSHKSNLAMEVNRVKRETFAGLSCTWFVHSSKLSGRWFHCSTSNTTALFGGTRVVEASVQIPPSLFYQLEKQGISTSQPQQLLVSMYENNNFFPKMDSEDDREVESCVIGTKLVGQEVQNLTEPVYVMFRAPDSLYHYSDSPLPVWWDSSLDNGLGGWNKNGCNLSHYLHGLLVFQCNRLGYFGLLQKKDSFYTSTVRTGAKFRFSHPVVYIGSFVCIVCLTAAIVTYALCHASIQMSKKAKHSLTNTWIAMALLCFMYSTGIHQTEDIKVCQGVGLVLHYLSLSSLLWMTVTASNMYKKLTKSDSLDTLPEDELPPDQPVAQKPLLGLYLVGWGIALIVCGISGAVNMPLYASHWHCFLSTGPSLGAVFVPAGILISFLVVMFLLIHCAARNIDANGQHSEGTQVTENVDLDMLDSNITSNGVGERTSLHSTSAPTASSEVEDPEHSPLMQLKAHVIVLLLYIFTWTSASLATAKPFKNYISYEETAFSILYGFLSTGLGSFVLFFYCIARSDVRSQWHLVRCWCKKKRGRCCRTRSISDTNPSLPHTQPVPTTVIAHSGGVVVSSTNSVNSSSHKSQNSNAAKAATELNGIVQTMVKSDRDSGGSSENKSNVDLVVLHRQMYRSNNSVTTYTELSGASGAEMFYNPHQSTVARKFFRKQRRQAKAANLCSRRSGDGIRENGSSDPNTPAESAVFLSSEIDNSDGKKHINNCHRNDDIQNVGCIKDSSSKEPINESGMPLERLVIGAEEAPVFKSTHVGRDVRSSIEPVEEVSEEVTSLTAEVGETESDLQCGLTNGSADCVSELGSESVSCRTSNGALSTSYDTQNYRTDHCSWQEHLDIPSDMAGSDNGSYKSSDCNRSSNSFALCSERTHEGRSEKDEDYEGKPQLSSFTNLVSQNACLNGFNGNQISRDIPVSPCIESNPIKDQGINRNADGCVCDRSYPVGSDQFVNKRETSV